MNRVIESQLQVTLNLIPAYTWYAAPSGGLAFVNQRSADYLGLPADHPLRNGSYSGAAWDSHIPLLHPDDHEETRRVWSAGLSTGDACEVTFRVRNAKGDYRWFLSRAEPVRGADGCLQYWVGINFEIHELKQAQFYLAEGQRLAHTGSWSFNAFGFAHWSSELFTIHGLDPRGKPPTVEEYLTLIHPDDREPATREIERMLTERRRFDFTKRIVRPDGGVRQVRCVGTPATSGGVFQGFVGTGIDVTDQEELTKALRKGDAELRQMLDLVPQIVGVLEPGRGRIYANRTALAYYGLTLDEWRHQTFEKEVHPDDVDRVKAEIVRSSTPPVPYELELRLRGGNGAYRWFLVRYNPLLDDGKLVRWYLACTDIEDRKRAEERLLQENVALREEIDQASMFEEIVGASPALAAVLSHVSKVAGSNSTVLLTGETGTGKELVARAIHRRSRRASRAFVAVNCAAIPRELILSELFGHEKGAFTGAIQRRLGRFELADGGTIFLDEVGELSPEIQAVLLRALQEQEFERVGGTQAIKVDVRVIAATNRDLKAAVDDGTFRADLFYRLNVFPLEIPPLRDRRDDIPLLLHYFIDRFARRAGKTIRRVNKRTLNLMTAYPWPGNVRELQNVIERSIIVSETDEFTVDESWLSSGPAAAGGATLYSALSAREKAMIEDALRASGGRVFGPAGAAARLGIPRSTLESRIRALRINKNRFRV
jgi:PAS domain S-box-containing protein